MKNNVGVGTITVQNGCSANVSNSRMGKKNQQLFWSLQ